MVINVEVKFLGVLRQFSGRNHALVSLEEPATVKKIIQKLTEIFSSEFKRALVDQELEDPRPNLLILVNGKEVNILQGLETEIINGDEIVMIPVSHGG